MKALALVGGMTLVLIACGLFGGPPGKEACRQFERTIADWRQGGMNTFEFREELEEVREKAAKAESEIQSAAAYLARSANNVSEDRLEVGIAIMGEACAEYGYHDQEDS